MPFLRGLRSESIDLIATDPPFNKGRDFHSTPDKLGKDVGFEDRWRWVEDVHDDWVNQIKGDEDLRPVWQVIDAAYGASGEDMAAFLCFLGVRLIEMRRLLAPTGSIYLHCDSTANGYIRALMDSIFGRRNFRNEIKWCYTGPGNVTRWFPRKSDSIFFYVKDDKQAVFNPDAVRVPFAEGSVKRAGFAQTASLAGSPDKDYEIDERGKRIEDWWTDIGAGAHISKHERVNYPTQKPLALYERIIKASSSPGDMVLDPFAGCATTPIAAERLGRQWIAMDLWDGAYQMILDRLETVGLLAADDARRDTRLITRGEVLRVTKPPERPADDHGEAAPFLATPKGRAKRRRQRPGEKAEIASTLAEAQRGKVGVVCAGCGVDLHRRYFHMDHRAPSSGGGDDGIANRVLLCAPCNGRKSYRLTIPGLRAELRKAGEMTDARAAEAADLRAQEAARAIRDKG